MTEQNAPCPPTRRQVAKGAAWTVPVLTTAGMAPALAASPQQCSVESERTINNMVTEATQQTYPLTLNIYQPTRVSNGGDVYAYFNLRNDGARTIRASAANPIVLRITARRIPGSTVTTNRTITETTSWGSVTKGAWDEATESVTFTWRITQNIPPAGGGDNEADMRLHFWTGSMHMHTEITMTSFGVNDDTTSEDFTDLEELVSQEQVEPCRTYYQSQVVANTGTDAIDFTLQQQGPMTGGPRSWAVGETVDSRSLGNYVSGSTTPGYIDGIW